MEFSKSGLSNYCLFSHSNVDKLLSTLINESSNAVMLEAFDDSLLLADIHTGKLYLSDYKFDGKKVFLENFQPIDIVNDDNQKFQESVSNFFDAEGYDTASLIEAYESTSNTQTSELSESILRALSKKNKELADYTQLVGINESLGDFKNTNLFKNYTEHLQESPSTTIRVVTWDKPVVVSLINEDLNKTIFLGSKDKAKKLMKDVNFRKEFIKAVKELSENDDSMKSILFENKSILTLSESELKEFVGMSIMGDKELIGSRAKITEAISKLISENEELNEAKNLLTESDVGEDDKTEEKTEKLSVDEKELDSLQNALDKALENITDEKVINKINDLKDALETSKSTETTDVAAVKECIEILSL